MTDRAVMKDEQSGDCDFGIALKGASQPSSFSVKFLEV